MVNKVILVGNLGDDPEVRYLENDNVVANIRIATNETFKDRNGERQTRTEWHSVVLWGGLAKVAAQYLKKGNTVYVEGKLTTEMWTDNDGNNRKTVRIRANSMTMLGGKAQSNGGGMNNNSNNMSSNNTNQKVANPIADTQPEDLDDLPF